MKKNKATPPDGREHDESGDAAKTPAEADAKAYVGTGFYWPAVVGVILAAGLVIMVFQNTDEVRLKWLWMDIDAPLIVVLLVTVLVTGLLTEVFGWIWRRKRRRTLAQRDELKRLKKA